ncbi:MAG TPA: toll/interleukin-1 receptor domain-containing protein, partial [Thermoanaerobaculia bacterium]|nr:toll/interleukin-1 receptor domain-containing protein [Thermoanaerobaculia bacterium]
VDALAAALEARGVAVWQDVQDLRAGDNWNDKLFRVIDRLVNYVVVVQTKAMLRRIEGVFHEEIAAAKKRQARMGERDGEPWRFLIAVRVGDCGLLSALQSSHVIDVGTEEGVDALARSILEDWERRATLEQAVAS